MPGNPDALEALPFIALSVLPQPRIFTLDHGAGHVAGGGVPRATTFLTQQDVAAGRLVRLLPAWSQAETDIHAVYPASPHVPHKVRVFIDALKAAA
nr:LysR substrate-binding domain-containing protein [uncultured Duganella sp.]